MAATPKVIPRLQSVEKAFVALEVLSVQVAIEVVVTVVVTVGFIPPIATNTLADISTPAIKMAEAMTR